MKKLLIAAGVGGEKIAEPRVAARNGGTPGPKARAPLPFIDVPQHRDR